MNFITQLPKKAKIQKRAKQHFLDKFPAVSIWHIRAEFFNVEILAYTKPCRICGTSAHASIRIRGDGNHNLPMIEGLATGCGYDKIASAISDSAHKILESIGNFAEFDIMSKKEYAQIDANFETIELLQKLAKIGAAGKGEIQNIPGCICVIGG